MSQYHTASPKHATCLRRQTPAKLSLSCFSMCLSSHWWRRRPRARQVRRPTPWSQSTSADSSGTRRRAGVALLHRHGPSSGVSHCFISRRRSYGFAQICRLGMHVLRFFDATVFAVLNRWPPRLPVVAPCDRRRVLATWSADIQRPTAMPLVERSIPFAAIRTLRHALALGSYFFTTPCSHFSSVPAVLHNSCRC